MPLAYTPPKEVYDATLPGTSLLKLKAKNLQALESEIDKGLSVKVTDTLTNVLGVSMEGLSGLLGIGYSTLKGKRSEKGRLSPETSSRVYRMARIFERTVEVIGSEKEAKEWLNEPVLALGRRTPLEAMKTDLGCERVEQILERLDDGVYS
jgi:putative toxin-antitoxin system antitoxin component (TIGR02293 family)